MYYRKLESLTYFADKLFETAKITMSHLGIINTKQAILYVFK